MADIVKEWQLRAFTLSRSLADSLLIADGRQKDYVVENGRNVHRYTHDRVRENGFSRRSTRQTIPSIVAIKSVDNYSAIRVSPWMTRYRGQSSVFQRRGSTIDDPKDGIQRFNMIRDMSSNSPTAALQSGLQSGLQSNNLLSNLVLGDTSDVVSS